MGIVDSCNTQCESSFLSCSKENSPVEFKRCETELKNGNLSGCEVGCAPTFKMLSTSQTPLANLSEGRFGSLSGIDSGTTKLPQCQNAEFGSFDKTGSQRCRPKEGKGPATGDIKECSTTSSCVDSPLEFKKWKITRKCGWVAKKDRCSKKKFASHCPDTCNICSTCQDSSRRFKMRPTAKNFRSCKYISKKREIRCAKNGVSATCRATCGLC